MAQQYILAKAHPPKPPLSVAWKHPTLLTPGALQHTHLTGPIPTVPSQGGALIHTCDSNTWKAKKGVLPEAQGQLKSKALSGESSESFQKFPFRKLGTDASLWIQLLRVGQRPHQTVTLVFRSTLPSCCLFKYTGYTRQTQKAALERSRILSVVHRTSTMPQTLKSSEDQALAL